MSHLFAHVPADGIIDQVVVVSNQDCGNLSFPDSEPLGQAFLHGLYRNQDTWLETSEDGSFRGRYARIGGTYDPVLDEFISPPAPEPEPDPEEEP
jgi:hypothetical protein